LKPAIRALKSFPQDRMKQPYRKCWPDEYVL
jgi:hypothetical protein